MTAKNCIETKDLVKTFAGGKTTAVDHLSLTIEKGQTVGLIGADGAGKTTLLRLIGGLLLPDAGSLSVCGLDPVKDKARLSAKIGYMPQKFGLYEDLTVRENLEFYADLKNIGRDFSAMLAFAGLSAFQERLAGKLSGGMKQKLGLVCALAGSPELILLDEPSFGVDPVSRRELLKMVKSAAGGKATVLWSTAYMDEAHGFDTVIVIDKGRIIYQGRPGENNTFHIRKGEIFGLLGPNGAGKSTSFKMMCGLAKPTSGTARIMGTDIVRNASAARAHLGYMAQKFSLYPNLSVRQNLEFFAGAYGLFGREGKEAVERMTEIFGFARYLDSDASELPLGYKQRLSLACAVMHNPPVLFLDEPTSGVDVITRREFWNHIVSLARKGVTVLITTHFMDEAEFCDRISLFYRGRTIATGTPAELKNETGARTLEEAFVNIILQQGEQTA